MRISQSITVLIALLTLSMPTWALIYIPSVSVKPSQIIKGSVTDETIANTAPEFIATPVALQELWAKWKIADPMPVVDFSKSIIVVGTTSGSILNLDITLDKRGNMKSMGMATMDFLPGFRYVMPVVSRAGVKTFNGKAVPTKWDLLPIAGFTGSVADRDLQKNASEYITEAQPLADLWKSWGIADKMPTVDFAKQIVVISTTVGSTIRPSYSCDINGNITVAVMMTKDIRPGFRYAIAVISREGAVSIDGKTLPGILVPSYITTGQVKDLAQQKDAPIIITTPEQLKDLWQKWQIATPMPEANFPDQMVIVSITNMGGPQYTLDAKGDLKVQFTVYKSWADTTGFRYVIAVLNRTGIKSVDGIALGG